jgi:hypothetical protein
LFGVLNWDANEIVPQRVMIGYINALAVLIFSPSCPTDECSADGYVLTVLSWHYLHSASLYQSSSLSLVRWR